MIHELRLALRTLAKSPGFALACVLTLALGIGANTAIFTIVNTLLLRPLPLPHPERLVYIQEGRLLQPFGATSFPDLRDYRIQNTVFEQIEAVAGAEVNLKGREWLERIQASAVTPGYLAMLGAPPLAGRTFASDEDQPGKNRVIVLREDVWRANLGGDPKLLGKTILVNSEPYTLIGIMPARFRFPGTRVEAWVPLTPDAVKMQRGTHFMRTTARLKPGVTLQQAQAQMDSIFRRLAAQYPEDNTDRRAVLRTLHDQTVRNFRQEMLILLGAVLFVFLIGCANVANLLLARSASRSKEFAIRRALGVARWRVLKQHLAEALILASAGTILGSLLALWGVDLLQSVPGMPLVDDIAPDLTVLSFTIGLSIAAALLMSLAGALQSSRVRLNDMLKEGGRTSSSAPAAARIRRILVIGEIAAALVLLVSAGLLIESFWKLYRTDPGFNPRNVLTMHLSLPQTKYSERHPVGSFYDTLLEKLSSLPGVESAAVISALPLDGWGINSSFEIEGQPPPQRGHELVAETRQASPDYFRTMGIPLLSGRAFSNADSAGRHPVAVINKRLADIYFRDRNPIGQKIRIEGAETLSIIGVVGDIKEARLASETSPAITTPCSQNPHPQWLLSMNVVLRTSGEPTAMTAAVRRQIASIDPDLPVFAVRSMERVVEQSIAGDRGGMLIMGTFAALAALLAAIGIYGVISYLARQRTQEIGIRIALGAGVGQIFRIVVFQGLKLTGVGIVIGILGALAFTRVMAGHIYVSVTDPVAFTAVPIFLGIVALLATIVPALSASRVDPIKALRHE